MAIFLGILKAISWLCGSLLTIFMLYQLFLTVFGFKKTAKDYADHAPSSRFLVLVPAHNEGKVIGDIVENLKQMDYPSELYDFYIIADNCTDNTAEKARSLGARVLETWKESPDAPTGKPIALRKALQQLENYHRDYDLMMVFDADNLIDRNMFREVNSQYLDKGKPDLIQCYLGSKNKKGPVAWFYYTGYTLTNRFFDLAKQRLNLNGVIGGTGFAITTSYLYSRGGWTTMSLTEDFEIQVEATLEGRRILWNHTARVYDEKPTTMIASIRQKIRWGQGHWYVTLHNTGRVFKNLFSRKLPLREAVSLLTYMYSVSTYLLVFLKMFADVILYLTGMPMKLVDTSLTGNLWAIALFCYSYLFLFYLADRMDNGIRFSVKTLPVMIVGFFASLVVGVLHQLVGLIRCGDQKHWVKTEHCLERCSIAAGVKAETRTSK